MFAFTAISAFILLESRDVVNGFLTQPYATALLLVLWGYDPVPVLLIASATQLIYLNRQPSGASLFPEYPFGFFIVTSAAGSGQYSLLSYSVILILIMTVSSLTSHYLKIKRSFFEKHRERLKFYKRFPNIISAVSFSYLSYFLFSLAIWAVIYTIFKSLNTLNISYLGSLDGRVLPVILCILLSSRYIYFNLSRRNE
ncbi:MAG TPA: hypothetical protein PKW56_01815 [Clostridiales bacterium]|nr:hypothetical protein [Clostridiales bacterium]